MLKLSEIAEVYISKSTYHGSYKSLFPKASIYSDILSWLKGEGGVTTADIFGDLSPSFDNLRVILKNRGGKKEKEKAKAKRKEKGKNEKKAQSIKKK